MYVLLPQLMFASAHWARTAPRVSLAVLRLPGGVGRRVRGRRHRAAHARSGGREVVPVHGHSRPTHRLAAPARPAVHAGAHGLVARAVPGDTGRWLLGSVYVNC